MRLGEVVAAAKRQAARDAIPARLDLDGDGMARKRVAILISGRGSNMVALIEAAKDHELSRRDRAGRLQRARRRQGLQRARSRRHRHRGRRPHAHSARTARRSSARCRTSLQAHAIELVCLAGFMRLLTPWFVRQWDGRLLNIHPALLPAFKGLDTHARALAAGAKKHGATVHFVVPEMDSGPIIAQGAVPVLAGDTEAALAARVLEVEHASIRWRCGWWRKAACGSSTAAA